MDRRGFVGSVIAGGASLLFPRKSEAALLPAGIADDDQPQYPMQWWKESSFSKIRLDQEADAVRSTLC